jgi:hypothetical protein
MALQVRNPKSAHVAQLGPLDWPKRVPASQKAINIVECSAPMRRDPLIPETPIGVEGALHFLTELHSLILRLANWQIVAVGALISRNRHKQ